MAGVLLATVGAAALLGRSRERRWAVELKSKPHLTPHLAMRLPEGWQVDQTDPDATPLIVTATQRDPDGDDVRVVEVVQFSTAVPTTAPELLATYLSVRPGVAGASRPVRFLGQPGVLVPFVWHYRQPGNPLSPTIEVPEWYAATVVPRAGQDGADLGVVVGLGQGAGAGGPAGARVVAQVASGLALRATPADRRPRPDR